MVDNSTSRDDKKDVINPTKRDYDVVRLWNKGATACLFISAVLVIADSLHHRFDWWLSTGIGIWPYLANLQIVFIVAYHFATAKASILHFEASKKKYPILVDDVYGTSLSPVKAENYYDSSRMKTTGRKLAYDVANNVYFSYRIMQESTWPLFRNVFVVLFVFIAALILDQSSVILFVFKLTIPVIWLKKALFFFKAKHELALLNEQMHNLLVKKVIINDMNAESLKYAMTYEALMAWLNTPVSNKAYTKYGEKINKEFSERAANYKEG